jgi:hypothetical protein
MALKTRSVIEDVAVDIERAREAIALILRNVAAG